MKPDNNSLWLHEEILLLALRDEEGTTATGSMYQYALGGALLAELLLANRVRVDESTRRKLVEVVSPEPVGESVIDACLLEVVKSKRRRSLDAWVSSFAVLKHLKHRIAGELAGRGILRIAEGRVLGVFSRRVYPTADPQPERELRNRITRAVLSDSTSLDPRTVALISLAHYSGLLGAVLSKSDLKARKARIAQVINGEVTGRAVKEVIEALQAATTAAALIDTMG
jgi:golgi phosphoprotein 3